VRKFLAIAVALAVGGLTAATAGADTFKLTDSSTLEGEIVSATDKGAIVRLPDGKYSERVAWEKFSQEDLKRLAKNPKYAKFAQALVIEEETVEQKKKPARPAIVVKPVEAKLERPANPGLIGGLFGSPVGWFILLALYAANLWAAFEVALFRAQPVALVCGLAAVLPGVAQIVFLSLPTRVTTTTTLEGEAGAVLAEGAEAEYRPGSSLKIAQEAVAAEEAKVAAQPTIFKRGETAFNRRFFETRFSHFFGLIRRDKDKGSMLIIKTPRGHYTAARITRITANDMHIEVMKGGSPEEISVPFGEIQEIQLHHGGVR
jgi:hypothetical protein